MKAIGQSSVELGVEEMVRSLLVESRMSDADNDARLFDVTLKLGQALGREQALQDRVDDLLNEKNQLLVDLATAQSELDLARNDRELLMTGTDDGVSH